MNREGAHAIGFAVGVETNREQSIGGFRLPIRQPFVIGALLVVRIVEVDRGIPVPARRERYYTSALSAKQGGPQTDSELKVTEMVGGKLRFIPPRVAGK